MMGRRLLKWLLAASILAALGAVFPAVSVRGWNMRLETETFTESNKLLFNPDRGFYAQCGYVIQDEPQTFEKDTPASEDDRVTRWLRMVQINLRNFRSGEITDVGLENVDGLFETLSQSGRRYIVRFLYDWDGEASRYEPEDLDTILRHMEQVAPILHKYSGCIYTLQGLFIGNWGEMNGTPFVDAQSLKALAYQLAESTPEQIPLAVRMPMYWRRITDISDLSELEEGTIACRIGLYNDGMLGSESDYGTYGIGEPRGDDPYTYWTRSEELPFQQELCKHVPNGGEVIVDNEYNDFENAVDSLKTMHISYLNWDFDRKVLDKWAKSTVTEPGCYQGMDGLSYVERHLGYRYVIENALMSYDLRANSLTLGANVKNVGFAPAYSGKTLTLTLEGEGEKLQWELPQELCSLAGGSESEQLLFVGADIPLEDLHETRYRVYLELRDDATGQRIALANELEAGQDGEYGVYLGEFAFERVPWYDEMQDFLNEIKSGAVRE